MSATVLYMSVSLDGFVAGPNEGPGNGLGDGGERLHEWAARVSGMPESSGGPVDRPGVNGQVVGEYMSTGAVVAGRGTFEPAGGWSGDHHGGVPIFIYSRHEPGIDIGQWPLVTYTDDLSAAICQAKQAAGDRNVLVHGAAVAQLALAAGLLDEPRAPRRPGALRPGAPAVRQPGHRADRARAHPDPRGGGRRHPHALPNPALRSEPPAYRTRGSVRGSPKYGKTAVSPKRVTALIAAPSTVSVTSPAARSTPACGSPR
jgi:dihydrofolate reductase